MADPRKTQLIVKPSKATVTLQGWCFIIEAQSNDSFSIVGENGGFSFDLVGEAEEGKVHMTYNGQELR